MLIELDLPKDLGLSGTYTPAIDNPMTGKPGSAQARPDQVELRPALLAAVVRSIGMEIDGYTSRLQAAKTAKTPRSSAGGSRSCRRRS